MITVTAEQVQNAINEVEQYAEISLRPKYSGRAMYGLDCFGVVGAESALVKFELALAIEITAASAHSLTVDRYGLMDNYENIVDGRRQDNMGYSTIYYYPGIEVDGEFADPELEDAEE